MINYCHTVTYQKCNDCKFVGMDIGFQDYLIKEEAANTALFHVNEICPVCDSKNISEHYYDEELTRPVKEVKYDLQ